MGVAHKYAWVTLASRKQLKDMVVYPQCSYGHTGMHNTMSFYDIMQDYIDYVFNIVVLKIKQREWVICIGGRVEWHCTALLVFICLWCGQRNVDMNEKPLIFLIRISLCICLLQHLLRKPAQLKWVTTMVIILAKRLTCDTVDKYDQSTLFLIFSNSLSYYDHYNFIVTC